MSTVLRPVGPQPARVYWVRRLVVLGALVVLLLGTVWAIGSRGADDPSTSAGEGAPDVDATGAEDPGAGEQPDAAVTSGGPMACEPADLTVALTADARSYAADERPVLALTVTNTSEEPCTLDVGSGNQVVTVMSGEDRIWSSADCAGEDPPEALRLLDPGAAETTGVDWKRERSEPGCTPGLPEPRAGTYTAVASVLEVESGTLVFELG